MIAWRSEGKALLVLDILLSLPREPGQTHPRYNGALPNSVGRFVTYHLWARLSVYEVQNERGSNTLKREGRSHE